MVRKVMNVSKRQTLVENKNTKVVKCTGKKKKKPKKKVKVKAKKTTKADSKKPKITLAVKYTAEGWLQERHRNELEDIAKLKGVCRECGKEVSGTDLFCCCVCKDVACSDHALKTWHRNLFKRLFCSPLCDAEYSGM